MSDVKKDIDRVKRLHLSGNDKLHITSLLNDFMIKLFKERIRKQHPQANASKLLKILREELAHGRRDNV